MLFIWETGHVLVLPGIICSISISISSSVSISMISISMISISICIQFLFLIYLCFPLMHKASSITF